jgi:hypothetical protein
LRVSRAAPALAGGLQLTPVRYLLGQPRRWPASPSPRNNRIGAAMKTEELAVTTLPNTIGMGKLSTALSPQVPIARMATKAVTENLRWETRSKDGRAMESDRALLGNAATDLG